MDARRLGSSGLTLRPLGVALPRHLGGVADEERLRAGMERALTDVGVDLVDLGGGPARAVREAVWSRPTASGVGPKFLLVREPLSLRPGPAEEPSSGAEPAPRVLRAYELGDPRLGGDPPRDAGGGRSAPVGPAHYRGVVLADPRALEAALPTLTASRPDFAVLPVHLLNAPDSVPAVRALAHAGVGVLASDPFAGGRLSGAFLTESTLHRGPAPRPRDWYTLRRELAPILSLGFLTDRSIRTLPEAALEFAAGVEGVTATLIPAASPGELIEAQASWGRRPLTDEDRRRLTAERPRERPTGPG